MISEGDSTWCLKLTENKTILFHYVYRAKEAEKLIGFAKTHDELIILTSEDKNETKYNSISFWYYNG